MKVKAFICCYQELDILPWVLDHLTAQGVEPYVIDNWSTDGTKTMLEQTYTPHEQFPDKPSQTYDWHRLLRRVEQLAAESDADWVMHCDSDEIRRSPWPELNLAQAFERVDGEGYNAVDHRVFNFRPVDNGWDGSQNPEEYFRYYEPHSHYDRQHHIKAWKPGFGTVDLATSGGHQAWFEGRKVHPTKFILKHYGIRSDDHGKRKVLQDRIARRNQQEYLERGWHVHLDALAGMDTFLVDPAELVEWHEEVTCSR